MGLRHLFSVASELLCHALILFIQLLIWESRSLSNESYNSNFNIGFKSDISDGSIQSTGKLFVETNKRFDAVVF